MVFTESSNNPFKLEDEDDRSRLMVFFGRVKDRLVTFLADRHERIVPDILEWDLTQCDINKDIKVGEGLQYTGIKVQVKHFGQLFRVYIKAMGKDTVCRVEESVSCPKGSPAVKVINSVFNPLERIENQVAEMGSKVDKIVSSINYNNNGKGSTAFGNVSEEEVANS